ncbi:MAG: hypothetical protein ACI9SP_001836 [Arenicella sp.]
MRYGENDETQNLIGLTNSDGLGLMRVIAYNESLEVDSVIRIVMGEGQAAIT